MSISKVSVNDNSILEKVKVIASAWIENDEGKVLAIKRKDTNGNFIYVPPGGRPAIGECLRDCVKREVKEEINVDVEIDSIKGILEKDYEGEGIWTIILYKAIISSGAVENNEIDEIKEIAYINPEQLDNFEKICWVEL